MQQHTLKHSMENILRKIKNNPDESTMVFNASSDLVDGTYCKIKIRNFDLYADEPQEIGGSDQAPNPVELVLASLASCQEIIYSAYAAMMNIPLETVHVDIKGEIDLRGFLGIDDNVRPGFEKIEYSTTLVSSADDKDIQRLQSAVEKHCPVLDTLTKGVKVHGMVKQLIPHAY